MSEKLKGKIVPLNIFMDVAKDNQSIYYVTTSKNKKALKGEDDSQIQIKEYDPQLNNVLTLLTLRMDNILVFTQLADGRFVLIDEEGDLIIYKKNKTNTKLVKAGKFFVHSQDTEFIIEACGDFEQVIIDSEVLVI